MSVAVFTLDIYFADQRSGSEAARTVLLFNSQPSPLNNCITRELCNRYAGFIIFNPWKIPVTSDHGPMKYRNQITCEKKIYILIKLQASVTSNTNDVDNIATNIIENTLLPSTGVTPLKLHKETTIAGHV